MKAVVMAGGEGSRLRPLTVARPKPLVPIVNKPVMGHILDLLRYHGITDVVVTLRFMASAIQDTFDDGSQPTACSSPTAWRNRRWARRAV